VAELDIQDVGDFSACMRAVRAYALKVASKHLLSQHAPGDGYLTQTALAGMAVAMMRSSVPALMCVISKIPDDEKCDFGLWTPEKYKAAE